VIGCEIVSAKVLHGRTSRPSSWGAAERPRLEGRRPA